MRPSPPAGIQSRQTGTQDSELVRQGIYRGFPGVQEHKYNDHVECARDCLFNDIRAQHLDIREIRFHVYGGFS